MTAGAEGPEEVVEGLKVEILGVSTQPGTSSTHERRAEVQQPGSPSVLMPTSRVVEPSPTTGVLSGKAPITETSWVRLSYSSSEEHEFYSGEEVDFGMNPLFLIRANSRIYQRKRCRGTSLRWFRQHERLLPLRVFLLFSLIVSPSG